eukprot:Lankesteria_metandrocarpae@DN8087_c0_g1_i1.p1
MRGEVSPKRRRKVESYDSDGGPRRSRSMSPETDGVPAQHDTKPKKLTKKSAMRYRAKVIEEHFGYSGESNPFGDANLVAPFVWKKKVEQQKASGHFVRPSPDSVFDETKRKISEIESVKLRRETREREEELLEEQRAAIAREKEQENYEDWVLKERAFHKDMAEKRVEIRIEQGRQRPVDVLAKLIQLLVGGTFQPLVLPEEAPHTVFDSLTSAEIESAIADIRLLLPSLSTDVMNVIRNHSNIKDTEAVFWSLMVTIAKDAQLRTKRAEDEQALLEQRLAETMSAGDSGTLSLEEGITLERDAVTGIPVAVAEAISKFLDQKTLSELLELETSVELKLSGAHSDDDMTYWEAIQSKLPLYLARAKCHEIMKTAKATYLVMKAQHTAEGAGAVPTVTDATTEHASGTGSDEGDDRYASDFPSRPETAETAESLLDYETNVGQYSPVLEPYDVDDTADTGTGIPMSNDVPIPPARAGTYSPPLRPVREFVHLLHEVLDPIEDRQAREKLRILLIEKGRQKQVATLTNLVTSQLSSHVAENVNVLGQDTGLDPRKLDVFTKFVSDERQASRADEINFNPQSELSLDKNYDWEGKYKPRKPRFFNRIKTGYEWNKYNQTHYDYDNPPPKAVQGYKFNIFYPDLIDKTSCPSWTLEPLKRYKGQFGISNEEVDSDATCILRFHAGPPYEDVAFKVINRQWEMNIRRGYRNCFDRGILQLYFNFTRYRYRR